MKKKVNLLVLTKLNLTLLFIFQVLDGLFTYRGVINFNTLAAEGNPLVKFAMAYLGVIPGLVLVKVIACVMLIFLYTNMERLVTKWFALMVGIVTILYLIAIVVWIFLLF